MLIMADPTIILVHGAFADASSWSRLYGELAGGGLTIEAPPNRCEALPPKTPST
jgi:hypothetical protein